MTCAEEVSKQKCHQVAECFFSFNDKDKACMACKMKTASKPNDTRNSKAIVYLLDNFKMQYYDIDNYIKYYKHFDDKIKNIWTSVTTKIDEIKQDFDTIIRRNVEKHIEATADLNVG